jgi:hypothetical protein
VFPLLWMCPFSSWLVFVTNVIKGHTPKIYGCVNDSVVTESSGMLLAF